MKLRRSKFFAITLEEREHLDVEGLLRGEIALESRAVLIVSAGILGDQHVIQTDDLAVLTRVPSDRWTAVDELAATLDLEPGQLEAYARRGLLLSDLDEPARLRDRRHDETLTASQWHPASVSFWAASRRELAASETREPEEVMSMKEAGVAFADFVERHGVPPPAFYRTRRAEASVELAPAATGGALHDLLRRRKTHRSFDRDRPLAIADLATLLYWTFGCQGVSSFPGGVTLLAKTSPSGGSLHPIEAYPIVLNVDGISSGVYHYDVRRHALDRLRLLTRKEAGGLAVDLACGQRFADTAGVVVMLAARFERNFWKYRHSARTLAVILMDAGHLGQTFYLVATDLGLGAFYSAAVDLDLAAAGFELDGVTQGAVALCGCGSLSSGAIDELERRPFDPVDERDDR